MKSFYLFAVLTVVPIFAFGQVASSSSDSTQPNSKTETPSEVVNKRMDAYNRHDIDSFMACYDDEIEILTYSGKSLGKGKKHIRRIFEPMFEEGVVQVEIHYQIEKDSYVVNHETVTNGDDATEYVSIYEVRDGLITSVRFVRD